MSRAGPRPPRCSPLALGCGRGRARRARARSASRSATPSPAAASRRARTRPACGGSTPAGRPSTAAPAAARSGSAPPTGGCRTAGRRVAHFALPGSMPRTTARAAWLDWRFNPQAPSTNPAFLIVDARAARGCSRPPPARAPRRARRSAATLPAGSRGLELTVWCSPANGPGWCNWAGHLLELRGVTLELEESGEPSVADGGALVGGAAGTRASCRWRSSRRTGTPACAACPSASAAWPSARSSPPSRCTRRPAAAVPADAARHRRRRHPARAGRRPAPAARGHRRGRQHAHAWTPATVLVAQPAASRTRRRAPAPPPDGTGAGAGSGPGAGSGGAAPVAGAAPPASFPPNPLAGRGHVANGRHASERARLRAWLEPGRARSGAALRRRSVTVPYGQRVRIRGRLTDERGRGDRPGHARRRSAASRAGPGAPSPACGPAPTDASRRSPASARRRSCGSSTTPTATRPAGARARRSGSGWSR